MADLTGPEWLTCLSDQIHVYQDDIDSMDDDSLMSESYRVEVEMPPSLPQFNDRDWRTFRRLIRQEMHNRGLTTPTSAP